MRSSTNTHTFCYMHVISLINEPRARKQIECVFTQTLALTPLNNAPDYYLLVGQWHRRVAINKANRTKWASGKNHPFPREWWTRRFFLWADPFIMRRLTIIVRRASLISVLRDYRPVPWLHKSTHKTIMDAMINGGDVDGVWKLLLYYSAWGVVAINHAAQLERFMNICVTYVSVSLIRTTTTKKQSVFCRPIKCACLP